MWFCSLEFVSFCVLLFCCCCTLGFGVKVPALNNGRWCHIFLSWCWLLLVSARSKLHADGCVTPFVMQCLYSPIMTSLGGAEVDKDKGEQAVFFLFSPIRTYPPELEGDFFLACWSSSAFACWMTPLLVWLAFGHSFWKISDGREREKEQMIRGKDFNKI